MTSGKKTIAVTDSVFSNTLSELRSWPWEMRERLISELRGHDCATLAEAARIFGCSWRTVWRHVKSGDIAAVRAGRRLVVTQAELDRIMRDGFPFGQHGRPKVDK